jgi:Restriction Endonuclease associating with ARP
VLWRPYRPERKFDPVNPLFAPSLRSKGPLRSDLQLKLEDFFYEPFYQLLRQQMLAFQMQEARDNGTDRVRVLHITPAGNRALKKVTPPALRRFGHNAFEVWKSLLVLPDDFVSRSTESLFTP